MNDGLNAVFGDQFVDQRLISDVAGDEPGALRHGPVEAGREIIQHHDLFAAGEQVVDHVAADIAGAAGDKNSHLFASRVPNVLG